MGYKRDNVTPEMFGALGDGTGDDTTALQAWLDSVDDASVTHGRHLVARGNYSFTGELLLAPSGASRVTMDVQGARFNYNGADGVLIEGVELTFDGTAKTITRTAGDFVADGFTVGRKIFIYGSDSNDKLFKVSSVTATVITADATDLVIDEGPVSGCRVEDFRNMLTLGDPYASRKLFYARIIGIYGGTVGVFFANALLIHHCDFLSMESGSLGSGGRALFLASPAGSAQTSAASNSAAFHQINLVGGRDETALMMGNVWTWRAGKIQQSTGVGMHVYKCSTFEVSSVDFSIHPKGALKINKSNNGLVHFYTEQIGPGTVDNDTKLLHGVDSNNVTVQASLFNCAGGGTSSGLHSDYGIYLENCHTFQMQGSGFLPMKALLFCDSDCGPNTLMKTMACVHTADSEQHSITPIIDDSGRLTNEAKGKFLTQVPPSPTNYIDPDLTTWTFSNGAVHSLSTVKSDDLGSDIRIVELQKADIGDYSGIIKLSTLTVGAATKGIRVRVRMRLVAFRVPLTKGMALAEILIRDSANFANVSRNDFRIGDNWDWYEVSYTPPGDSTFEIFVSPRQSWEPMDIAIDGIEMIVE